MTVTIRITHTWDVEVPAEFGDTDASLLAKVSPAALLTAPIENRNLLHHASHQSAAAEPVTDLPTTPKETP